VPSNRAHLATRLVLSALHAGQQVVDAHKLLSTPVRAGPSRAARLDDAIFIARDRLVAVRRIGAIDGAARAYKPALASDPARFARLVLDALCALEALLVDVEPELSPVLVDLLGARLDRVVEMSAHHVNVVVIESCNHPPPKEHPR
jgi:hypothetical protein